MRRMTAILLPVLVASAQRLQQNPPPGSEGVATFTTSTQLVVEAVTIRDKKGNPVEGLTAKDFTITEDGKPQTIAFVEYQKLPDTSAAEPVIPSSQAMPFPQLTRTR